MFVFILGHFYEKHFIPFPLTDLEIEPPPSKEGPSLPKGTARCPQGRQLCADATKSSSDCADAEM